MTLSADSVFFYAFYDVGERRQRLRILPGREFIRPRADERVDGRDSHLMQQNGAGVDSLVEGPAVAGGQKQEALPLSGGEERLPMLVGRCP